MSLAKTTLCCDRTTGTQFLKRMERRAGLILANQMLMSVSHLGPIAPFGLL